MKKEKRYLLGLLSGVLLLPGVAGYSESRKGAELDIRKGGSAMVLEWKAPVGSVSEVLGTEDLLGEWHSLDTVTVTGSLETWSDEDSQGMRQRFYKVKNKFPMREMVYIAAGEVEMGDHHEWGFLGETPVHNVSVSGFLMDKYEVTNKEYVDFLNDCYGPSDIVYWNDSLFVARNWPIIVLENINYDPENEPHFTVKKGTINPEKDFGEHPVTGVSWYGAAMYCIWRSIKEGLEYCYFRDYDTTGDLKCNFSKNGYRLPTEAEWEKAARGGLEGSLSFYPWESDSWDDIDGSKANYWLSGDPYEIGFRPLETTPGGSYPPNGFDLYDMAGNAEEWCNDWYAEDYYETHTPGLWPPDPKGPEGPGEYRVVRGGSYLVWPDNDVFLGMRCAARSARPPNLMCDYRGFRTVRPVE